MKPVRVELAHRANYGVRRGKIEWIVMHYTANDGDSGMSNARYFQKALNPVASAHYFVDDREIVQSVRMNTLRITAGRTNTGTRFAGTTIPSALRCATASVTERSRRRSRQSGTRRSWPRRSASDTACR